MKKIIAIIVPHGDDESLGFGGVIQQHLQLTMRFTLYFADPL